jgi:hypothetical protein
MATRRLGLVLCLALAAGGATAVPAAAACAGATPRVSLSGFEVPEGPRQFFLGTEGGVADFTILFAGGCNQQVAVDWATGSGTATAGADYAPESGTAQQFIVNDEARPHPLDVAIHPDGEDAAIVESVQVTLSNPRVLSGGGSVTMFNSSIPILIVDSNGSPRIGFEGIPYSQSETFSTARIPVFRAGEFTGSTTVGYTIEPSGSNPATPGVDYTATSPGTLTFDANEARWIDLSVVNDQLAEGPEDVTITLTGDEVVEPSTTTFTILDNEENVFPVSRFHHPKNKWKYNKADYRIREFHIFATDEGGSGVVAAELALRRNLKNGKCAWKTKSGWQKKDCQNRTWLPTKYDDVGELFYYRMKQLKASVKTKIKDYTAFARAIDGAGNIEKEFTKKRNMNTFEIRRKGKTIKNRG